MLNYIWLGLVVIAILVGVGRDVAELSEDKFRNDKPIQLQISQGDLTVAGPNHFTGTAWVTKADLARHYGSDRVSDLKDDTLRLPVDLKTSSMGSGATRGSAVVTLPAGTPGILKDAATAGGDAEKWNGRVALSGADVAVPIAANFTPEPVRFRIMSKIANEGILKIADTAVTLALGLIGIMALWLGVMKIAETAGIVTMLAKLVRPVMVRLFPEVPADHPAMGAMVLNMTANFLGLSNAATPMGLKAMEELNKLNPHAGTATNAMCMFLTINTTAITMVPATVIAIRFSLGASEPADIIMPTFLATLVSMTLGVVFTRFIQRFYPLPKVEAQNA